MNKKDVISARVLWYMEQGLNYDDAAKIVKKEGTELHATD